MYVRVKREKTTIFLHVEPTDTILEVKQKLQELCDQVLGWNIAACIAPAPVSGQPYLLVLAVPDEWHACGCTVATRKPDALQG